MRETVAAAKLLLLLGLMLVVLGAALLLLPLLGRRRRRSGCGSRLGAHVELLGRPMRIVQLSADPVVRLVRGFASSEEALELISRFEPLLQRSTVSTQGGGDAAHHESRTSWSAFLPAGSGNDVIQRLEDRAVLLTGKPRQMMETLQLVRYADASQFYKPHFDWFVGDPESQRTTTIFLYLNDTQGEAPTHFPRLGLSVSPECGAACIWENAFLHGRGLKCDERLKHAGVAPLKGQKYGVNIWFRTLPFRT